MADPMASIDAAKAAFMRDVRAAMYVACDQGAELLLAEMKALTARIDHDLKALRDLGHPYGWGNGREPGTPHADWIVHMQDGELQGGLKKLPPMVSGWKVESDLISEAKQTWYLLLGTKKMRPRDFVSAALIMRRDAVAALFEKHFLAVHDRTVGVPSTAALEMVLLPHDEFPAQLPGGY